MKVLKDISYGKEARQKLDLYLPDKENCPLIIYFHGGGIESGDKSDANYAAMAKQFNSAGYAFASVNYGLYTQGARFPDFIYDCAKAVCFVKSRAAEWGCGNLIIAGQSAGAWLALMLCVNPKYLKSEDVETSDISAWLIDSAQTTSHFNVLKYEKNVDSRLQRIDEFAPLYYVDGNLRFNRMLVCFYSEDMPCRKEQNLLFIRTVKEFFPQADLQWVQLQGGHCRGSCIADEDGGFAFVKTALSFLG